MVPTQHAPIDRFILEIVKGVYQCRVASRSIRCCHRRHCATFWCGFLYGWFLPTYFEGSIIIELLITVANISNVFPVRESKWIIFLAKFHVKRPRYVLSSTAIVITTSPSSTRALRPPVPLHWLRKQRGNLIPLERKRRSYTAVENDPNVN